MKCVGLKTGMRAGVIVLAESPDLFLLSSCGRWIRNPWLLWAGCKPPPETARQNWSEVFGILQIQGINGRTERAFPSC